MKRLLPISMLVLLIAGCSGGLIRLKVEKGIRDTLPEYIGPAKKYSVRANGSEADMVTGFIRHLHIEGIDAHIDPSLMLSQLTVDMYDVRYKPTTRELKSVGSTNFEGILNESALNAYIANTREDDLSVKLEPGKVQVEFIPKVVGVNVLIKVSGKPVIAGGDKVNFEADSASVAHLPIPALVVNKALETINPILDMAEMMFPIKLEGITVRKGAVVIKGSAQFKTE